MRKYKCVCGYTVDVENRHGYNEKWLDEPFVDINEQLGIKDYKRIAMMGCPKCSTVQFEYR